MTYSGKSKEQSQSESQGAKSSGEEPMLKLGGKAGLATQITLGDAQGLSMLTKCGIVAVVVFICVKLMRGRSARGGQFTQSFNEKSLA